MRKARLRAPEHLSVAAGRDVCKDGVVVFRIRQTLIANWRVLIDELACSPSNVFGLGKLCM